MILLFQDMDHVVETTFKVSDLGVEFLDLLRVEDP